MIRIDNAMRTIQVKILVDLWKMHEVIYCLNYKAAKEARQTFSVDFASCRSTGAQIGEPEMPNEQTIECQI